MDKRKIAAVAVVGGVAFWWWVTHTCRGRAFLARVLGRVEKPCCPGCADHAMAGDSMAGDGGSFDKPAAYRVLPFGFWPTTTDAPSNTIAVNVTQTQTPESAPAFAPSSTPAVADKPSSFVVPMPPPMPTRDDPRGGFTPPPVVIPPPPPPPPAPSAPTRTTEPSRIDPVIGVSTRAPSLPPPPPPPPPPPKSTRIPEALNTATLNTVNTLNAELKRLIDSGASRDLAPLPAAVSDKTSSRIDAVKTSRGRIA